MGARRVGICFGRSFFNLVRFITSIRNAHNSFCESCLLRESQHGIYIDSRIHSRLFDTVFPCDRHTLATAVVQRNLHQNIRRRKSST